MNMTSLRAPGVWRRTETALLVGFLLLGAIVAVSGWRLASALADLTLAQERASYYVAVLEGLETTISDITEAETQQRGFLLTDDATYINEFDAAFARMRTGFQRLEDVTATDPPLRGRILDIRDLTLQRIGFLREGIAHQRLGDRSGVLLAIANGRPLAGQVRAAFRELVPQYETAVAGASDAVRRINGQIRRSFLMTSALVALVLGIMGVLVLVEARYIRSLSEKLLHAARHDELTRLPNRAYANEWLERSVAAARRSGEKLALLYLDLNGFKQVNDRLGHAAGDAVLVEIARLLRATARDADFVARLGGDEFAVIMPRIASRANAEVAARRFGELKLDREGNAVGASVGFALFPDDAQSAESLLKAGDAAMYARKQAAKRG